MSFSEEGFDLMDDFIASHIAEEVISEVDSALLANKGGGIRNAEKKFCSIAALANSELILARVAEYLNGSPRLVRAIIFDKTAANNWLVAWHQDKTVSVSHLFEEKGWGPWSIKDGVNHVQPPLDVLNSMLTLRIHLDATTSDNGCLKIIPKSHSEGILNQDDISLYVDDAVISLVEAEALSALVMRPHLLHASNKALKPSRRRVLHLEYSTYSLPAGVNWA